MNEQELMKFVIERSNDPIIKNPVLRDAMNKDLGPRNMYVAGGVIKAAKKLLTKTPTPKPTPVKPSILKREAVPLNLTQISEISKNKEFEQAWKNYKISIRKVGRRKYNKDQFFEMWARENMAQGGRIGYADKNAGTLVKKLIPLDKKKLDKANLKRATESVDDLYSTYTKEVIDNAAKEWAEMSNLEPNRTTPIKIQNLDEMEN